MNMTERRDKGLAYISDEEVFAEQAVCRRILQKLNFMDRSDFKGIAKVVKGAAGKIRERYDQSPFLLRLRQTY